MKIHWIRCSDCNNILNPDEERTPAKCVIPTEHGNKDTTCGAKLCDTCAAGLSAIPPKVLGRGPSRKADGTYDGFSCSQHFNEEWA